MTLLPKLGFNRFDMSGDKRFNLRVHVLTVFGSGKHQGIVARHSCIGHN